MIKTKDIIDRYAFAEKFPRIMDEMGWDLLQTGIQVETAGDLPDGPLIEKPEDLKEFVYSISKAKLVHFCVNEDKDGVNYFMFRLDLYKHAGYPGGESGLYVGRIVLAIEENGFGLLMGIYL